MCSRSTRMWTIFVIVSVFLQEHVAHVASDDPLMSLFLRNLYEDFKIHQKDVLTETLKDEITRRVGAFQGIYQQRQKRETREGSGVHIINGFEEAGTIPVNYPIDICLFKALSTHYAAVLHRESFKSASTFLKILRSESGHFVPVLDYKTHEAEMMDCVTASRSGFVAVVNRFSTSDLEISSPVFRITDDDRVETVLRFSAPYQNSIHLWAKGDEVFLSHTFMHPPEALGLVNRKPCPFYKWTGNQFILIDQVQCLDSHHLELFEIDYEVFLVVANFQDDHGTSGIFSFIYKLDPNLQRFVFLQRIFTNAAHDIRHFEFEFQGKHDDFLIVENAFQTLEDGSRNYQTESAVYKFVDGYFVPFQSLVFDNVTQVLPVVGPRQEFILLVACEDHEVDTYQYDGWSFKPAPIDYSRDAFGRGVRSIRYYNQFSDESLIVIANENHIAGDTAFYFPKFKLKNDIKKLYDKFLEYAQKVKEKYSQQNLHDILESLRKLPKITDSSIAIEDRLDIGNAVIQKLETYALFSPRINYDAELVQKIRALKAHIDQVKSKLLRVQGVVAPLKAEEYAAGPQGTSTEAPVLREPKARDFEKSEVWTTEAPPEPSTSQAPPEERLRKEEREEKPTTVAPDFKGIEVEDQMVEDVLQIDDLYIKNKLTVELINGRPMKNLVRDLRDPSLNVVASEVTTEQLFVKDRLNGIEIVPYNLLLMHGDQFIQGSLEVQHLSSDRLYSRTVNEQPTTQFLRSQEESVGSAGPKTYQKIIAEELFVDGYFNNLDIRHFDSFLLKPRGNQALEAPFEIDTLKAKDVTLNHGTLSGKEFKDLVFVNEGAFILDTAVEFSHPVQARQLFVTDRLNNIQVKEGRLDVLLKNANFTQVVTGHKVFENVQLRSPIKLHGKIRSESLQKMNPNVVISDPLELDGDYEIHGDVTVKSFLEGQDIQARLGSVQRLHQHGLPLASSQSAHKFRFTQPIRVHSLKTAPSESFNPDDFIRTGTDETQYVTGHKTFGADLHILQGFCEAAEVNRVNLEALERNVLKKKAPEQVVQGSVHFTRISSENVAAVSTTLGDTSFQDLLTLDSDQDIPSLTLKGPTTASTFSTHDLLLSGSFNERDLSYLIDDTVVNDGRYYHITGEKTLGTALIDNLEFPQGGRLNGIDMNAIAWDLDIFSEKYISINETMYLQNPLKVRNLRVNGVINGVSGYEFGKVWLLSEGEQTFTEPVTLQNAQFHDNLLVEGLFNGHDLSYLHQNTIWTDKDEVLDFLDCEALSSIDQMGVGGLVAGFKPSSDLFIKNSTLPQHIPYLNIEGDLSVHGPLEISSTLNGVDFPHLSEFTANPKVDKVKVKAAHFHVQPSFGSINGFDVQDLYTNAWLSHRNTILQGHYHFNHADFSQNIVSTGLVNEFDLEHVSRSYFSLTTSQDVPGRFYFENGTILQHLTADSATIGGTIKGLNRKEDYLNLEDFNKHAFKRGADQEITAMWSIYEVHVKGNLENVRVNDLSLVDDVVRFDVEHNHVTGPKFLNRLHVENVVCSSPCVIQEVDVMDWMANAVLTVGNFTVQSPVSIENITVFNDLKVFGTVNGLKFDESTLFLRDRDQNVQGEVVIRTKFPLENKILPVFLEHLNARVINNREVDNVLHRGVIRGRKAVMEGVLNFMAPLKVTHLHADHHQVFGSEIVSKLIEIEEAQNLSSFRAQFEGLKQVSEVLQSPVKGQFLSEVRISGAKISGTFSKILAVHFKDGAARLVTFDQTDPSFSIQFYKLETGEFRVDENIPPLKSKDMRISDVQKVTIQDADYLVLDAATPLGGFRQTCIGFLNGKLYKMWGFNSSHPMKFTSFRLGGMDCFLKYSKFEERAEVACIGPQGLFPYQVLEGAQISKAVTIPGPTFDSLLLLTEDRNIAIYHPDKNSKLSLKQTLQLTNPSEADAICRDLFCFLAVTSDRAENAASTGAIEIFRSYNGSDFSPAQTILVQKPKQVLFTTLASEDTLLYVLTENPAQAMIIFKYGGVAGFQKFVTSSVLPLGSSFVVVKQPQGELLGFLGSQEVTFIEPVLNSL